MALPADPSSEWPPRPHRKVHDQITKWNRLYALTEEPTRNGGPPPVTERLRNWVTGTTTPDREKKIRLPATADVAQTSADLLFGEPLIWQLAERPDDPTQTRFDELTGLVGLHNRLLEAAEIGGAHGGVYLRPVWDTDVADHPLVTVQSPTHAVPEWTLGILRAVTFWEEINRSPVMVWRHLERHEPGRILHGLYAGTDRHLGKRVALDSQEATAGFDDALVLTGGLTGRLLPDYIPNMLPNRTLPGPAGRADIAGSEDLVRSLDTTWSSWMRDLRVGQARVIVDESFLTRTPGLAGASFNLDNEIFTPVRMDPRSMEHGSPITPVEFALRVEEHAATAEALFTRIVSTAGYSPESFGIHAGGPADSGRALKIRQGRTWRTKGRKQGYWTAPLQTFAETLLLVDREIFGSQVEPSRPTIRWPDGDADDPRETAETLELLYRAKAMSAEMRVRLAQPQLDQDELAAEVGRIREEDGLLVEDPIVGGALS